MAFFFFSKPIFYHHKRARICANAPSHAPLPALRTHSDSSKAFAMSDIERAKKLSRIARKLCEIVKEEEQRVAAEETARVEAAETKVPPGGSGNAASGRRKTRHKRIKLPDLLKVLIDTDTERVVVDIGVDPRSSRFDHAIRLLECTIRDGVQNTIGKTLRARAGRPDSDGNPIPDIFKSGRALKEMIEACERVRDAFKPDRFPGVARELKKDAEMKLILRRIRGEQRWKLLRLIPYVKNAGYLYALNFMFKILTSVLPAVKLHYMGQIAKAASRGQGSWTRIKDLCAAVAAVSLLSQVLSVTQSYFSTSLRFNTQSALRTDLYAAMLSQDMQYFDEHRVDELRRAMYLPAQVLGDLIHTPLDMLAVVSRIAAAVMLLWSKSPQLALASLAALPVTVPMSMRSWSYMRKLWQRSSRSYREGYNMLEVLSNIRTVRSFGREAEEVQQFDNQQKALAAQNFEATAVRQAVSMISSTTRQAIDIAYMCLAGYLVQSDASELSSEDMVLLVDSARELSYNFATLFSHVRSLAVSIPRAEELVNILNNSAQIEVPLRRAPSDATRALVKPCSIAGHIEFKDVHFHYPTRAEAAVLNGLSFRINKNAMVALVGPSGSGKSTVVKILQRFYRAQRGTVRLDGRDINDYDPSTLRQLIGVVSQEPVLFDRTIRENLVYGCLGPEPSDAELIEALKKAHAWEFVKRFPERLRTEVGARGTQLSGGQKQRIAIARALLSKPKMLLLDEATSALDTQAEAKVQAALDEMIKEIGGTTLVIAHRLSTIRKADKIIVVKDGRTFEEGSHAELLRLGGLYARLVSEEHSLGKGDAVATNGAGAALPGDGAPLSRNEEFKSSELRSPPPVTPPRSRARRGGAMLLNGGGDGRAARQPATGETPALMRHYSY